MTIQNNVKSAVLTMKNLYFKNINFEATGCINKDIKVNANFKETHNINEQNIEIKLFAKVKAEQIFTLNICLVGIFEIDVNFTAETLLPNAIAIMFPYLRSQVSLMTAQPNIPPILLPAINIVELLKNQKQKDNN